MYVRWKKNHSITTYSLLFAFALKVLIIFRSHTIQPSSATCKGID